MYLCSVYTHNEYNHGKDNAEKYTLKTPIFKE